MGAHRERPRMRFVTPADSELRKDMLLDLPMVVGGIGGAAKMKTRVKHKRLDLGVWNSALTWYASIATRAPSTTRLAPTIRRALKQRFALFSIFSMNHACTMRLEQLAEKVSRSTVIR